MGINLLVLTSVGLSVCLSPSSQNAMLPAGMRQRDQTKKSPTGPYDRDALMQHLEKLALEHEDREDLVPFTGEKKGACYVCVCVRARGCVSACAIFLWITGSLGPFQPAVGRQAIRTTAAHKHTNLVSTWCGTHAVQVLYTVCHCVLVQDT